MNISGVGEMGVGETGVGEMGQIIAEMGVGKMGVGEMGTSHLYVHVFINYRISLSICGYSTCGYLK